MVNSTLTLTLKSTQSDDIVKYEIEHTVSAEENVKFSQVCQFLDLNIDVLGMILNKSKVQFNVVPRVIAVAESRRSLSIASLITGIAYRSAPQKSMPVFAMIRKENVYYSVFGKWNAVFNRLLNTILHPPRIELSHDVQECVCLVCYNYLKVPENCDPVFRPVGFHDMWDNMEALEFLPNMESFSYSLFDGKFSLTDGFKLTGGFGAFLLLVHNMLNKRGGFKESSDESMTSFKQLMDDFIRRMFERNIINPTRNSVSTTPSRILSNFLQIG
jgi:hypothetical protein